MADRIDEYSTEGEDRAREREACCCTFYCSAQFCFVAEEPWKGTEYKERKNNADSYFSLRAISLCNLRADHEHNVMIIFKSRAPDDRMSRGSRLIGVPEILLVSGL